MALQRKNFRCPRDGGVPVSPLRVKPLENTTVVISHADLPPRQRKRVQVGSTNLSRNISTPELPRPVSPLAKHKYCAADNHGDPASAAYHIRETNIDLMKESMRLRPSGPATAVAPISPGLVVRSERRRREDSSGEAPRHEEPLHVGETTTEQNSHADHPGDTNDGTVESAADTSLSADRAFFIETRKKLYEAFVDRYGSVRAVFKAFDKDSNGHISYQRFTDMVDASEVELSPADIRRVFRQVDRNEDNSIAYQEFSEMFTASEYVEHASAYSPTKVREAAVAADPTSSLALKFRAPLDLSPRARERMKELRLKVNGELLHKHGRDLGVHGGKTENLLIYAFKQFDTDNDGFLSYDQVKSALGKEYLQLTMEPSEMDEMVRMVDRNADERISMKEFVQYFGAGKRELPTDLIDYGRRKELAALHYKANVPLTPRNEFDPEYFARRQPSSVEEPLSLPSIEAGGCMQENLSRRIATSPVFRSPPASTPHHFRPRAQTSHGPLSVSQSTPTLSKRELGPTLNPLAVVSQDRHEYWRVQRTDWTRVGVGGDGMRADAAQFASDSERFRTTTREAFSPMLRGVNSGDVYREAPSTSEQEARARATRRQARHEHTQELLAAMASEREKVQRLAEWKARARTRLGAARRFEYLDRVHEQEQRVAMREQQMAKRHGGARFHRMWAGSADSQFNNTHVTGPAERNYNQ